MPGYLMFENNEYEGSPTIRRSHRAHGPADDPSVWISSYDDDKSAISVEVAVDATFLDMILHGRRGAPLEVRGQRARDLACDQAIIASTMSPTISATEIFNYDNDDDQNAITVSAIVEVTVDVMFLDTRQGVLLEERHPGGPVTPPFRMSPRSLILVGSSACRVLRTKSWS